MKTRLETQTKEAAELTTKINELHAQILVERQEKEKLQMFVKSGSLPDDTKMGAFTAMPIPPPPTSAGMCPVVSGVTDQCLTCINLIHMDMSLAYEYVYLPS